MAQCVEHGAGAGAKGVAGCACACPQRAPLFREDRQLCVDDLPGAKIIDILSKILIMCIRLLLNV